MPGEFPFDFLQHFSKKCLTIKRRFDKKRIEIDFFPSHLSRLAGEETIGKTNNFEGVKIIKSAGRLLVIPERNGEHVRILAEADTMEAAFTELVALGEVVEAD